MSTQHTGFRAVIMFSKLTVAVVYFIATLAFVSALVFESGAALVVGAMLFIGALLASVMFHKMGV